MPARNLVERFCTPPPVPETEYDRKAVSHAELMEFPFEGRSLTGYSWGAGKNVLLLHGWGSRASHMAFLGRHLAKAGFRVLAFDGPAHGRSVKDGYPGRSSMFEFCRSLSAVARAVGPVYAVVGHSLGAASAAFTVSGHLILSEHAFPAERLVLISTPCTAAAVIKVYCRQEGLGESDAAELARGLEADFNFSTEDYSVSCAVDRLGSKILLVHDEEDEETPFGEVADLSRSRGNVHLHVVHGTGHKRILVSRDLIGATRDFLTKTA